MTKLKYLIIILLALPLIAVAQNAIAAQQAQASTAQADSVKKSYVHLLHADVTKYNKRANPDVWVLVGDVTFRHDSMYLYCDSAYFYNRKNAVKAFGNVRMEQGDTLFLYGDYLDYDGDANLARVRNNVRLEDKTSVLETDSLDYNRTLNLGYYFGGGVLYDNESTLESEWGEYNTVTKEAVFRNDVNLQNPQFIMGSDTLHYNTDTDIAKIVGPTRVLSGQNKIYSELGYYDTRRRQATLLNRSVVANGNRNITADSLFSDELTGLSEAFGNIVLSDKVGKNMLAGEYGYFNSHTDSIYITGMALAVDYSQGDSLYLHADTIWMVTINADSDSMYRQMRAYNKVRAYRKDIQAVCDSLIFDSRDSCMTMYKDPILWNGGQQLVGEEIKMYMDSSSIDYVHVINQALYADKVGADEFNQINGKEMKFIFEGKRLSEMQVIGSVHVVYFPLDEDSTMLGMNTTLAGKLVGTMKDGKMHKLVIPTKSSGAFYPMSQIPAKERYLDNYVWFDYVRPLGKDDIFHWRGKRKGEELKKVNRSSIPLPTLDRFKENNK
jgi:lipopolysaccharide export system protein LptA